MQLIHTLAFSLSVLASNPSKTIKVTYNLGKHSDKEALEVNAPENFWLKGIEILKNKDSKYEAFKTMEETTLDSLVLDPPSYAIKKKLDDTLEDPTTKLFKLSIAAMNLEEGALFKFKVLSADSNITVESPETIYKFASGKLTVHTEAKDPENKKKWYRSAWFTYSLAGFGGVAVGLLIAYLIQTVNKQ